MTAKFFATGLDGAEVSDDLTLASITLTGRDGANLVMHMDARFARPLGDTLTALDDEILRRRAPHAAGMKPAAYRKAGTVLVNLDATLSAVLLDFDPGAPHRVGVAVPVENAERLALELIDWVAKSKARLQTRQ